MKFNVFVIASMILIIVIFALIIFSISYYLILKSRYNKGRNLILQKKYLVQLFTKSTSPSEASQDANGDLNIKDVTFRQEDFQFKSELDNLALHLELPIDGSVEL